MIRLPNGSLIDLLSQAYGPCRNFGLCKEAVWGPREGHVPRGFVGATGSLEDVEVIMVFSEPGVPYRYDSLDPALTPTEFLAEGVRRTHRAFREGTDLFHRNVRWFMNELFPDLSFDDQLDRVWLTEGRLCSIANEIGSTTDHLCAKDYLAKQIEMMPNATVVGFGGKAQKYLQRLGGEFLTAYAMAPPGANHRPARPSWDAAISEIKARRRHP